MNVIQILAKVVSVSTKLVDIDVTVMMVLLLEQAEMSAMVRKICQIKRPIIFIFIELQRIVIFN